MCFYSIVEIGIREISATNTFAYAYVCLLRYVSNSIASTKTLVFPQDTSPSLTAVLGRFSILSVTKSLQNKVDAAGCSSPDEDGLLRRRNTVNTLHIVGSCRRGVGIEFDIRKLDTP